MDVAHIGERRNAYKILIGRCKGKRQLGRPRFRWVDNIRMDLREVGWEGVDWIHLEGLGLVAGSCECNTKPLGFMKGSEFVE
jgi:hypothetical protein